MHSRFCHLFVMSVVFLGCAMAPKCSRVLAFVQTKPILRQSLVALSSTTNTEAGELPIWNQPLEDPKRAKEIRRVRQHVNPLAKKYQQPTYLSKEWPKDVLSDLSLPLHLDIGCGRGGFLLEMAQAKPQQNYLGLEIRPPIFQYALDRVQRRGLTGRLTFVGCNANVDLDRILALYYRQGGGPLETVSIQFPDPHFKSQHAKRRVVTRDLVTTLAKHMPASSIVFLQSDIKDVLDDMRLRFREQDQYFQDDLESTKDYLKENPMGIQTERERSVIERDLPVYRTILRRTGTEVTVVAED